MASPELFSRETLDAEPVTESRHDVVAIGLGPFNLGLACLAAPLDLDLVVLESSPSFEWHPGLMLDGVTLQVPFLADLVTMADPTSPYSFLNYLKQSGRLYRYYIRESFFPLRSEYNAYCRWAAEAVPGIRFGRTVELVEYDSGAGHYVVTVRRNDGAVETCTARKLVLGIGTAPQLPAGLDDLPGPALHSAGYLPAKESLQSLEHITVVGSGQSAAEIYLDLLRDLPERGYRLDWVTRSPRFFPMEYTKLTLEMTSPEYVDYFHALPPDRRDTLLREQRSLYKGISSEVIDEIFETLYRTGLDGLGREREVPTRLLTCTEVDTARWDAGAGEYELTLRQWETGEVGASRTQGLVLATGYAPRTPTFLEPVRDRIRWDAAGRLDVARDYTVDHDHGEIFVQNAEAHTHGLSAPDLGMGAYRNSVILARLCGREVYPVERRIAFQQFGLSALEGAGVPTGSREVSA